MSVVTLQLGQCGNQVGQELYDVICSDAQDAQRRTTHTTVSCERFFHQNKHGDLVARAVLIDMEPKVIKQSMKKAADSGRWRYGDDSHFSQKQGSGNNWANGFCVHGPRHIEVVEELVRREVERCDRLAGFMTMMSVAGGTGSGVGTYVTQSLRDAYSKSFILNHLTWPYGTGEVIVQNYNSVLTLAHLYQLSDAILVHENDTVHRICSQLLNIKHISFSDVNRVIAHQLGSVLQPALTADSHGVYSRNPLGELVSSLACHPEYKLLSVCTIPQMPSSSIAYSTFSWPGLLKHLRQMLISNSKMEDGIDWQMRPPSASERTRSLTGASFNTSLANLLILRGKDVYSAEAGGFEDPALYTSWLSPETAFTRWNSPVPFNKYEKSATLVSNSQALLKPLDNMVRKAWNMFASRAYIHQYIRFGISEEDFLDSFTSVEQVISSYTQLCN
ncbi:tubulin delta chain [Solea senegalensis]|uniref:Tubulin delta chain n=1 Tax=Solea senegalensis TaxID=28829 RepID=A0AAV6PW19_SOLSE|nr:tubulin delta chain-like [Solea senegalensis]XP_043889001.1 tubulin delta chain-like [Solea senegalensis]KAG7479006.1 tubulin delta chain [Solea senegalensis]KAG7479795.1 tubulin delta chain [Solea senegalensis]